MAIYYFNHERLGRVIIHTRANASTISARWRSGIPIVIVPAGTTPAYLRSALDRMADAILAKRPDGQEFYQGRVISTAEMDVRLLRQSVKPHHVLFKVHPDERRSVDILVGNAIAWTDTATISRALRYVATSEAPLILLPHAAKLAAEKGMHPTDLKISHGTTVLGTCSRSGIISLSSRCIWLSQELRDYVMCHELAHLIHHDHSAAFHALCNRLTEGRETALEAALKAWKWPF